MRMTQEEWMNEWLHHECWRCAKKFNSILLFDKRRKIRSPCWSDWKERKCFSPHLLDYYPFPLISCLRCQDVKVLDTLPSKWTFCRVRWLLWWSDHRSRLRDKTLFARELILVCLEQRALHLLLRLFLEKLLLRILLFHWFVQQETVLWLSSLLK